MTHKTNVEDVQRLLKDLKDFALTVGEPCPEGHRREAGSGRCLPMGPTDHTAFTRSLNDDQGDLWRGLKDKNNETFDDDQVADRANLMDAFDMDEPRSCSEGTTFSFVQRKCITLEEAEKEDAGEGLQAEHQDIIALDPEGRKDTVNFECPEGEMFDHALRRCIEMAPGVDLAKELQTKTRNALPDSSFGVPGKRKFPLNDCSHVRNAMARFNQAKGLTADEKATLRRKILAKAKGCGINVKNFAKANTPEEFEQVKLEILMTEDRVIKTYSAEEKKPFSPCPPFMTWDPKAKKCLKSKGYVDHVLKGSHSDIIALDPEGRKDTVNFECPANQMFDHKLRKCIPLNKDTVMGSDEDAARNDMAPSPKGRPARLPSDCPKGTIWDGDLEDCKPLDSRKKTKSEEEAAKAPSGPGKDKDSKGCAPGEFFNPMFKKCVKGKPNFFFKKKAADEQAGREGLTTEVPGKVKLPYDCPEGTIWDGTRRTCTPLDSSEKNRPSGSAGPYDPKDLATFVDQMSTAQLIQTLDEIIAQEKADAEVAKVAAKDLPNEAFPPSLVRSSHRSLLHHNPGVTDPYDNASVNVARLRNALARVDGLKDYSEHALAEARSHLLYHAREIVKARLGKD